MVSEAQRLAGSLFGDISAIRPAESSVPVSPAPEQEGEVDVSSFRARFGAGSAVRAPYSADRAPTFPKGDRVDAAKALLTDDSVPDSVKGAFLALAVSNASKG